MRPIPKEVKPSSHADEALLVKTVQLNGKIVWRISETHLPGPETAVIGVHEELAGKTATLSFTVGTYGWSYPRAPERVCLVGPLIGKPGKAETKQTPNAAGKPLGKALEALKQLPASFRAASYDRRSYSGLLKSIITDPAVRSVESRIPLKARIAAAAGMWKDGRPDTAVQVLLRKGEVVHSRKDGAISVVGISEPMNAQTEAILMKDRPIAFCRRTNGKMAIGGSLSDWSGASWARLNENVSVASFDMWLLVVKVVNFAEDHTATVHGPDLVERTGRERFVSFNPHYAGTDLAARFASAWDDRNLYLVAEVTDNELCNIDPDRTYRGDLVEFFIDMLNDQTDLPYYDDFWYHVSVLRSFDAARGTADAPMGRPARYFDSRAVWKLEPKYRGYIVEMAIPWEELGLAPYAGHRIGFNVRVRDRDSERECKTIWWRAVKEPYRIQAPKRTFGWGELLLTKTRSGSR